MHQIFLWVGLLEIISSIATIQVCYRSSSMHLPPRASHSIHAPFSRASLFLVPYPSARRFSPLPREECTSALTSFPATAADVPRQQRPRPGLLRVPPLLLIILPIIAIPCPHDPACLSSESFPLFRLSEPQRTNAPRVSRAFATMRAR